jgi:hypothetical protein
MRRPKNELKLDEVKSVLRKLQRLDLPAEDGAEAAPPLGALIKADAGKPGRNRPPGRRLILYLSSAGAIIASVILLFAAGVVSVPDNSNTAGGKGGLIELTQKDQGDSALITEARQALSEGDALRARRALLRAEPERYAKVAFMLAQSYDPNYLQSLPKTNGLPDKAEAKRWYEKWYELASRSGLEMDSGRLQRIINAMP